MDSINQNQSEKNHEDLASETAIKKIKELIDIAKTGFLSTQPSDGDSNGTRPMNVQEVDEQGHLWFMIANDSHTYQDISLNANVKLYFQGSPHSDFLFLEGTATLSADQARIKELWNPIMKTWFTEGENDPRIAIIRVAPTTGYYWDTKHGNVVAAIKTVIGAAVGKTLDDSIEGDIKI